MKAIMVMFDSLNRHVLPPYGGEAVRAPNFTRLAEWTLTFDSFYLGSSPCMPARRDLHTGRYNFLHRSWGPIEPYDDSFPEILKNNGVYTHLATDHQHYFEDGGWSYHQRYSTWFFARGQEGDNWHAQVADPEIPPTEKDRLPKPWRQDWVNRQHIQEEADFPQARTFANGLAFIRDNHQADNWFLQIETFDPHEPFYAPQAYHDLYPEDYSGPHLDWPDYLPVHEPPDQVQHLRNRYLALVSMCDAYLGKVLDLMDELALWDDTMLIVNTDHGFLLGEHGMWAKNYQPLYQEIAHIPLFIWDPRSRARGERRQSLVQNIDIGPTLLEYFGVVRPPAMQGRPLAEIITADAPTHAAVLFGYHGCHVNITDGRYVYMRAPARADNEPLYEYTLMPTHIKSLFAVQELQDLALAEPFDFTKGCPTLKIPAQGSIGTLNPMVWGTLLFDLQNDPNQTQPLENPEIERRMAELLVERMRANDAPPEQYERLGLPPNGPVEAQHLALGRGAPATPGLAELPFSGQGRKAAYALRSALPVWLRRQFDAHVQRAVGAREYTVIDKQTAFDLARALPGFDPGMVLLAERILAYQENQEEL